MENEKDKRWQHIREEEIRSPELIPVWGDDPVTTYQAPPWDEAAAERARVRRKAMLASGAYPWMGNYQPNGLADFI